MKLLVYAVCAIVSYLVAGWNPAITLSKAIYKKDIRECGSTNPGFTNFKRTFGNKWAWWVLILDLSKSAIVTVLCALLFEHCFGNYQLGGAYAWLFALLGHSFPIWYGFKGGKGFLVSLSAVLIIDLRVGLIATAIMVVLLIVTKYMSVATVTAMLVCPILLYISGASATVVCICAACVLFIAVRHKENFIRLKNGKESRFTVRSN